MASSPPLAKGTKLGKYRLVRRLGEGTFGEVWKALDSVEGVAVALKIPQFDGAASQHPKIFQEEVKLVAKLDHHNIVKIKNADWIRAGKNRYFIIVTACGVGSLAERMVKPKFLGFIISVISQILNALAYAHHRKILHRDVKPENVILFGDGTARLTDFGIARIAERTLVQGEGTGTIGYMAPEQAYGLTSYASDVFSVGVLFYELLTGRLPPWPFEWPYPGHQRLAKKLPASMIHFLKKATAFHPKRRYRNAIVMEQAWMEALKDWRRRHGKVGREKKSRRKKLHWRDYKVQTFLRSRGTKLKLNFLCYKCEQPISEFMAACPWCGYANNSFRITETFPAHCRRCEHGIHPDWRFCPWCFRERFRKVSTKPSRDKRCTEHCTNPRCRRPMMPFMRYCPYCHKKTARPWKVAGLADPCPACRWGVAKDYWDFCAWCGTKLSR